MSVSIHGLIYGITADSYDVITCFFFKLVIKLVFYEVIKKLVQCNNKSLIVAEIMRENR